MDITNKSTSTALLQNLLDKWVSEHPHMGYAVSIFDTSNNQTIVVTNLSASDTATCFNNGLLSLNQ